jgi:tRNA nucleotidyltransferase/poly(A) polymerase
MFVFFEVGGAVRDRFFGIDSKDVDFACVAQNPSQSDSIENAFDSLHNQLENQGFKVFLSTPEFLTIRAQVPDGHVLKNRTNVADFVLARKDGPSSDGRRPDFVLPGTLHDDLSRRDFTINAMAVDPVTNEVIDPFNGQNDLKMGILRFVGNPLDRISEDGLRVLRLFRFSITKNLFMENDTWNLIHDNQAGLVDHHLRSVSSERIREELIKMFSHNTMATLLLLEDFVHLRSFLLEDSGLKLMPTFKQF